jgi:hypothetical protein
MGGVKMGCSKPDYVGCPRGSLTDPTPTCIGCMYHIIESTGTEIIYYPNPMAKTIDQFTTDELLAEIRKRIK